MKAQNQLKVALLACFSLTLIACDTLYYGSNMHAAAAQGKTDELTTVLASEAVDINATNDAGQTPLHLAIANGHDEAVRALVEKGADVNAPNKLSSYGYKSKLKTQLDGATPLDEAAKQKYVQIAKYLIQNGADVNARSTYGNTPLHFAYFADNNQAMIDLLTAAGGQMDARNQATDSPTAAGVHYHKLATRAAEKELRDKEQEEDRRRRQEEEDMYDIEQANDDL